MTFRHRTLILRQIAHGLTSYGLGKPGIQPSTGRLRRVFDDHGRSTAAQFLVG